MVVKMMVMMMTFDENLEENNEALVMIMIRSRVMI